VCGGTWQCRQGNSYDPPATPDADIAGVVTSTMTKHGAAIHWKATNGVNRAP
jgi:hypothetical protein